MNERIKKLRKALDLTQQEFADRIGVKRNTIATYEIGRNTPLDAVIASICREFGASEEWLRTGAGEMFVKVSKNEALAAQIETFLEGGTDSFRERLVSLLIRLSPEQWKALEGYFLELTAPAAPLHASVDAQDEAKARETGKFAHDQFLFEQRQEDTSPASPGDTGSGEKNGIK